MFSKNAGMATHAYDAACTCPRCAHSASNSACRCDACAAVPSSPAWLFRQGDRVVVWGNKGSDAPRVGVIVQCRRIRTVKDGYVRATDGTVYMVVRCEGLEPAMM